MARFDFVSLALALAVAGPAFAAADGYDLYFQGKVAEAKAAFQMALNDPNASASQRSIAARGLARIHWLVDGDAPGALAALGQAPSPDPNACSNLVLGLRIRRESGHPDPLLAEAKASACKSAGAKAGLFLEAARDHLFAAQHVADRREGGVELDRADQDLSSIDSDHAVSPDVQDVALVLAIERNDAAAALRAWRGYFWLSNAENAPQGMAIDRAAIPRVFAEGLQPGASVAAQIALERLLIRGGFDEQVLRLDSIDEISRRAATAPEYRPVAVYLRLRSELDSLILAYNRAAAYGRGDESAFEAGVNSALAKAAAALEPGSGDPETVLQNAYGYYGTVGDTGGYGSLHGGHLVQDERLEVQQGRRHGDVAYVSIDNLISNGFESWLWDGDASTGGWAKNGVIIQVRSSYTPTTLKALDDLSERETVGGRAKTAELDAHDRQLAASGEVVFLPGLERRLMAQGQAQVASAARIRSSRTGEPFGRVFAKLYWDAVIDYSIKVHEGRHVLDKASYTGKNSLSDAELEYRAKLSELEYSAYPRLSIANIVSANIGDKSAHGVANARVVGGLRDWLKVHSSQVTGFDAAEPALTQLDRLSDQQLRAFAHEADPDRASGSQGAA